MEFDVMRYYEMLDASRSEEVISELREISLEDLQKADVCAYFNVYGYALVAEEKWQEARDMYNTYLQYAREKEDKSHIHKAYHQLAMVERLSGRYSEALEYIKLEKAVIDKAFSDDPLIRSVNRYEYAYLMYLKGEICVAEEEMQKALEEARSGDDLIAVACCYRGLGEILQAKSVKFFQNSKRYFEKAGDLIGAEEIEAILKECVK